MKLALNIDEDELEVIIRDKLREAYVDQKTHWAHEPDSKKFAKAFKRVASYYSTIADHEAWLETVKDL